MDSIEFQLDSVRSAVITAGLMAQLRVQHTSDLKAPQSSPVEGSLINYMVVSTLGIIALMIFLWANFALDTRRRREIRELQRQLRTFENADR
jgi:heme/copper-type cytochrome/quinol oxidase subunit 2